MVRSDFGNGFEESGTTDYLYTRDHLGSVREVVESDGTTIASPLSYDPWAKLTESGSTLTDFGHTGHHFDRPTGLSLAQYRGYDPSLGRWLSRDPIGLAGGLNLYGYVDIAAQAVGYDYSLFDGRTHSSVNDRVHPEWELNGVRSHEDTTAAQMRVSCMRLAAPLDLSE